MVSPPSPLPKVAGTIDAKAATNTETAIQLLLVQRVVGV